MASEPGQPRIFVSYARSDGKEVAAALRRRLAAEGFALWQDLTHMAGGRDWWRQITEAIDHVEYLLLVMTPAALASRVVRDEWRYARQQGRCVIPIKGAPALDLSRLPGWMRRAHVVDWQQPEQWQVLVHDLATTCKVARVPMMAAELEADFVPRPAELEDLVAALIDPSREKPVAITAALEGAGGYGKTTLARALCHDERVQEAFHDGILWTTLGEHPGDPMGRVQDLIEVLSGARGGFQTLDAATTRLVELLADRRLLLVIDDVWQAGHLQPFLRGGPHAARLITTRRRGTLPAGSARIPVDAMAESEAVALLRFGLPAGEPEAFQRLAARLGKWPLLLELANGTLREQAELGAPVDEALSYAQEALDEEGLTAFDAEDAEARNQAVALTLEVSLRHLSQQERERFEELAVFPEDVDIPLATLEVFWGLTHVQTRKLVQRFSHLGLLSNLDLATRTLRLHDVVRHYLCDRRRDKLPELHARLVEAYRAQYPDGWHTGPDPATDGGYFFQWLPWHLAEAGRLEECRALAFDYRWLRRKLEVSGVNALIDDLERFGASNATRRLAAALRLSAHALAEDPRQLAGQLIGRLGDDPLPALAGMAEAAWRTPDPPALVPKRAMLAPPGTGLIRTLQGLLGPVLAVAALAERGQALSAGEDGTLRLWNMESGKELRRFEGHRRGVLAVTALAERGQALSAGRDGTVRLWDLESGQELRRFEGHRGWVRAVAALPERGQALSAGDDGTLRLWDLATGDELAAFTADGAIHCLAVTPDGHFAVTGDSLGRVHVLEILL